VELEVGWVVDEDILLGPRIAAIVIAADVPQHAVLFAPQHHVVEVLFPQGLTCTLLLISYNSVSRVGHFTSKAWKRN
jgi:hypothetical protein